MPYATRTERTTYLRGWYSRNREHQIAAVKARRKRLPPNRGVSAQVLYADDGWQERQRYAMERRAQIALLGRVEQARAKGDA